MWILPATFACSFGLVLGVYWLFVMRPEAESRQVVTRRLQRERDPKPERIDLIKQVKRLSSIPMLESILARTGLASGRLHKLLDSADVAVTVGSFVLGSAVIGAVGYVVAALIFRRLEAALILGLLALALPYVYVRRQRTIRLRKFEEQFPDAIDLIARAMRAGHGLTTGLGMVAEELGAPAGREFRLLYDWQNYGMSLPEALHRFADRMPLIDARFFVTSVLTQREAGGNLSEVLDNLSRMIRERFRVKRQIRVISAHGRMTGAVLGGIPPLLAAYFVVFRPGYLGELVSDPVGLQMLIAAAVLEILGVVIIRKLVDIDVLNMPAQIVIPLIGVFVSVALGTFMLATYFLRRPRVIDRRLRDIQDVAADRPAPADLDLAKPIYGNLGKIARAIPKSPQEITRLRRRMTTAGFDQPEAAVLYALAETALPIFVGAITLLVFRSGTGVLFAAFAAIVAFFVPGLWVSRKVARRKREIQNGLPDALDLLLVSMEAGAGMDQSIVKVSNELHLAYPALTNEFRRIVTEIRAGRPRADALRQFAERTKVEEVRSLVLTMIQTDKFGTSVGQALRTHAETARVKRRQRAEERAQKLGVKMVFPLVFCLFPAMFLVVLGPSVLRIIRSMGQLTK